MDVEATWTVQPWCYNNVGDVATGNSSNADGVTAGQVRHNSSNDEGVTTGQPRHNSSIDDGVTAGQVRHNASIYNNYNMCIAI